MTIEERDAVLSLLEAAESWHGAARCEGLVDHDWEYEPAVIAVKAVLDGKT